VQRIAAQYHMHPAQHRCSRSAARSSSTIGKHRMVSRRTVTNSMW
jgi:hypothetical protein